MLPSGFKIRFEGGKRAVAFNDGLWKAMQNIQPQTRAQIEVTMRAYCDRGPNGLPPQRFKFEYQHENAGKKTRIEAFKAGSVRFYGACATFGSRTVFLVTGNDTAKKQRLADQTILKASGKLAHELIHRDSGTVRKRKRK